MCCLFGLIDYSNCLSARRKLRILKVLSKECEVRGIDATGIAYIAEDKMTIYKKPLPAHKMRFNLKGNPSVIMGHTRMATQGSEKNNINNHPFYSYKLDFALAHNGVLYNDAILRKKENIPVPEIETDSYIAVQLIEKKKALNFETIRYMAEEVEGSFCFTILNDKNELYIVKGNNPMCIAHFKGYYIYASTKAILTKALKKLGLKNYVSVDITDGDIFKFNTEGKITKGEFDPYKSFSFYNAYGGYNFNMHYNYNRKENTFNSYEDDYLESLIYYGKTVGVNEETIREMLELGYDYLDVEDMLYEIDIFGGENTHSEI